MIKWIISLIVLIQLVYVASAAAPSDIETCEDEKCFKSLLKSRPSLMIMFTKTDKDGRDVVKVFKEVIPVIKGTATVAQINCDKAKKLCKKLKIQTTSYELKYYKDGTFNKDYDRQLVKKSMINFF